MVAWNKLLALFAAVGLALTVSACASQGPSGESPSTSLADSQSGTSIEPEDATSDAEGETAQVWAEMPDEFWFRGPLDEYIAIIWGTNLSPDEQQRRSEARWNERQELIAQCMLELGFEYLPEPMPLSSGIAMPGNYSWDRNWVAQNGYGAASSRVWSQTTLHEFLSGNAPPPPDPNEAIRNALSENEREAWFLAFWGPLRESSEPDIELTSIKSIGCDQWASLQVSQDTTPTAPNFVNSEQFRPILEAQWQLQDQAQEDPDLNREWANCMADAGHPEQTSARWAAELFFQELNQRGQWDLSSPEFLEIREREIDTALADFDCREQINFLARANKINYELEAQFVADNRELLNALRDAAEQAQLN